MESCSGRASALAPTKEGEEGEEKRESACREKEMVGEEEEEKEKPKCLGYIAKSLWERTAQALD